jgi:uncharacterized OB-fold protein
MQKEKEMQQELLEMPGKWDLPWLYAAGKVGSKYITALRDEARILATKCPDCGRVLLPPKAYCERCFVSCKDNWVELEPKGTLVSYAIVTLPFPGEREPPFIVGYFNINGATTNIPQFLEGVDLSDVEKARKEIHVGMPVKVVFKEKREGRLSDFHMEPVRG